MTERQPHTVSPESQSNNLSKRTPLGRQPGVTEEGSQAFGCNMGQTSGRAGMRKLRSPSLCPESFPAALPWHVHLSLRVKRASTRGWHFTTKNGEGTGWSTGKGRLETGDLPRVPVSPASPLLPQGQSSSWDITAWLSGFQGYKCMGRILKPQLIKLCANSSRKNIAIK